MRKDPFFRKVTMDVARVSDGRHIIGVECTRDGRWFRVTLENITRRDGQSAEIGNGICWVTNSSREALETYRGLRPLLEGNDWHEWIMEGGWPSRKALESWHCKSDKWLDRVRSKRIAQIRADEAMRSREAR